MKQELFKEMYNEIQLDKGQKERIWNRLEMEAGKGKKRIGVKRGFHAPAFATICVCMILVIGVPVLAANSSVIKRLVWSFGFLSGAEQNLTEEQKEIYAKYGSELKNEIKMDDITLKLEAVISDAHNICIPFSLNVEKVSFPDVVEEGIKEGKFLSVISAQMPGLRFVFKDGREEMGAFGMLTVLDAGHQKEGIVSGFYLLDCDEREIKQGDVIQVIDAEKWEEQKAGEGNKKKKASLPIIDEITIDKIAKSRNIPVEPIQKKLPEGISVSSIQLSPLSLTIEGNGTSNAVNQSVFNAGCELTIELKDGSTVKEASTGPQMSFSEEGDTCATALFKAPVNPDDVASIRLHSGYYGSYDLRIPVGEGSR